MGIVSQQGMVSVRNKFSRSIIDFFKINYKKLILVFSISACLFIIGIYIYRWEFRDKVLEIYFLNVNKGRSIFIRTPENKTILIGGGQDIGTIREITEVTPFYNRALDYVLAPGASKDEIGGLVDVLERYEVRNIIIPKIIATSTALIEILKIVENRKIHTIEVERGSEIKIENNIYINILFPYEGFKFNKSSLPEIAMSLSFSSTTIYFLGDMTKTIQKNILNYLEVKIGDYISKNSNLIEFYNNLSNTKVSSELIDFIKPVSIFSTKSNPAKKKTTRVVSSGKVWKF